MSSVKKKAGWGGTATSWVAVRMNEVIFGKMLRNSLLFK